MRILYLNPTGQMGGAETSLLSLMESLLAAYPDWQLTLFLGQAGPLAAAATRAGVAVELLPFPPELAAIGRATRWNARTLLQMIRSLQAAHRYRVRMMDLIKKVEPDVLHSNGIKMHAMLATIPRHIRSARAVRVCHIHDFLRRGIVSSCLLRLGARRFDKLVANSRSVRGSLLRIGLPTEKLVAIANGVNLARFTPEGPSADLDYLSGSTPPADEVIRIGLVATFAMWKGHTTYMQALALLPAELSLRAYILGGPIYQTTGSQYTLAELQQAARHLCPGVEIGFTGWVAHIEQAYRALDIVVHASTEPEPFGMVLVEAMASNTSVIFSNAGGAAEICEDEVTALAHSPGDAAMLAEQITRLVSNAALRRTLAGAGRAKVVASFQAHTVAEQFAELYQRLRSLST